ncbi:MAG: YegS/Rv2252/BmrU family lipid kinase [Gemmatimonadaceae bacterium]
MVNPAAGSWRGRAMIPEVRRAFAAVGVTEIRETRDKGDDGAATSRAIEDGFTTIVAVGGDGTWGAVARAIVDSGRPCALALLAAGTGNDFAKTAGVPAGDLAATVRLVLAGRTTRVDVGRIDGTVFLNVAGFGFDVAVLEDMERAGPLRGVARYYAAALRHLFTYRGISAGIARDEPGNTPRHAHLLIVIANARRFGGAFLIAPHASIDDGVLDLVAIRHASPLGRMRLFAAATRGAHLQHAEVTTDRGARFYFAFDEAPSYEVDGELRRARSSRVVVECLPAALAIVA